MRNLTNKMKRFQQALEKINLQNELDMDFEKKRGQTFEKEIEKYVEECVWEHYLKNKMGNF